MCRRKHILAYKAQYTMFYFLSCYNMMGMQRMHERRRITWLLTVTRPAAGRIDRLQEWISINSAAQAKEQAGWMDVASISKALTWRISTWSALSLPMRISAERI